MSRVLIAYGTRQGHAAHLAQHIAEQMRGAGHDVEVRDLKSEHPSLDGFDAVIIGASVHARGFEREVRDFAKAHAETLERVPNAFFAVSLTSANDDDKSHKEINAVLEYFFENTDWHPQHVARFAGAVAYSQYNWLLRHWMHWIVGRESGGRYQDMSHDYDLTDYAAVDQFAQDLADILTTSRSA